MFGTGGRRRSGDDPLTPIFGTRPALATVNYEVLKRMAKSVEYEYILNMNYTVVTF
jgi:hypothetical protein